MTKKYNFVQYKPRTKIYSPNEVSFGSHGIYISDFALKGYVSTDDEVYASVLMDVENKILAFKFYAEKDRYGKQSLIKLHKTKGQGRYVYLHSALCLMKVEKPKKAIRMKVKKTEDDMMIIDLSDI